MEEAAAALRSGGTTSADLIERALDAIERHQPLTNAFTRVDAGGARRAAERADRERAQGIDRGPLHGLPLSIKDIIDEAGVVTSAGSRVLRDRVAPADATVVSRLRAAGAILVGRTNLHEFALGTTSEDSAFGPVRNPHDPERSAGGSSGGSAAAVAAGMGLGSIGTDTGGSVRIPAAACGLVGLKPTFGEVPTDGVVPLSVTLDHVGPIAHSVQDAGWLFDALSGRTPAVVSATSLGTVRLTRLAGYFDAPMEAEVRTALEAALDRLTAAGVQTSPHALSSPETIAPAYANIVLPEAAHWHAHWLDTRADDYTPPVRSRIEHGRSITAVTYLEALSQCRVLRAAVDAVLQTCDALVLATLPITPPRLGLTDLVIDPSRGESMPVRAAMLKHTQLFNLTGHPAISLPVRSSAHAPVGLQLVGHIGRTRDLLALARACEPVLAA